MNELDKAIEVIAESGLSAEELAEKLDEHKRTKTTNYDLKDGDDYYYMTEYGEIEEYRGEMGELENFNAFPIGKRKLTEYIAKKQKLERALLIYSDLHGAEKLKFQYVDSPRYYIIAKLNCCGQLRIHASAMFDWSIWNLVYFNTQEEADRAIEIYRPEIEEVLRLQRELYK